MKKQKPEEIIKDIESAMFKTQIRLNAIRRCFPEDSVGAEMECHMYYLIKCRENIYTQNFREPVG